MWLKIQQERIKKQIDNNITKVMEHGQYILGPEVSLLEEKLSSYVGTKYAIGCSSGTDALLMALMAHGIKGDNCTIFTTPFTFISTAEVAKLLGVNVVFVDIDPLTWNINPKRLYDTLVQQNFNGRGGVIAVDIFGVPAYYKMIKKVADMFNLFVIEDGAQSFGAEVDGKKACSFADIGCTSFFPSKPLSCYGDGGMCFTDDEKLNNLLLSIRSHGKSSHKYDNVRLGINGRLDSIQAAILLAKMEIFDDELEKRRNVAKKYDELFKDIFSIRTQKIPSNCKSAWAQYSILFESSDIRNIVKNTLINSNVYYPKPLHLQDVFKNVYSLPGDFPISERISETILSIPMHPYLTFEEQQKIVEVIYENVAL